MYVFEYKDVISVTVLYPTPKYYFSQISSFAISIFWENFTTTTPDAFPARRQKRARCGENER